MAALQRPADRYAWARQELQETHSEILAGVAMPSVVDGIHHVIYVDDIYLAKNVVILVACSDEHVLSWYLARAETSRAWEALLSRIAAPDMVVTDGGAGFTKAARRCWPDTFIQRCLFHAFC